MIIEAQTRHAANPRAQERAPQSAQAATHVLGTFTKVPEDARQAARLCNTCARRAVTPARPSLFFKGITMSVYDKLKELNITLPPVAVPAAAYVPYVQTGKLVFLSGHIARKDGKPWAAQLGKNITTEEGKQAARAVAIDLLGTLHAATGGDLNRVQRIVKVMSLVNSTGDFTEQHLVTNGASELFGEVFGDKGKHARSAFGVAQIPMGACVEIELIAELN